MECCFCGKVCKNSNSLRNHERLCNQNPNRQYSHFANKEFQKTVNRFNQFQRAKMNGLPIPEVSEETRRKISIGNKNRSDEVNKRIGESVRRTIRKKVSNNEWHTSLAKKMHYTYKGIDMHGRWELAFAEFLDCHNIKWERCKDNFPYILEGVERKYTPDFYLFETEEYVEIKGFRTKKDEAKWAYFPSDKILTIYYGKQLRELGLKI